LGGIYHKRERNNGMTDKEETGMENEYGRNEGRG
jgi:hypothetical protein